MISRKVCLLGAFAVGKTSLVRRFVHQVFDERYQTTLGVRIDTKVVPASGGDVKLIIWDLEGADPADGGADPFNSRVLAYLQGVDAALLVADGTRPSTLDIAGSMHDWLVEHHAGIPMALLVNKADLADQWRVDEEAVKARFGPLQRFTTSALSGENIERTFSDLAGILSDGA